MNFNEYQKLSDRTAKRHSLTLKDNFLHGCAGICTESGELMDIFKKWYFYGKEIDRTNVKEEVGDILWYLALICTIFAIPMEDVAKANINKLKIRYPDKFKKELALIRDIEKENKALQK
jgi:NTP pyrophosphatase (non-canonical NTP hydrolase)